MEKRSRKRRKTEPRPDREEYLQALVTEFTTTTKDHAKEQIAANLANFSYDPANYAYLAKLNVVDLFLDLTDDENLTLHLGLEG